MEITYAVPESSLAQSPPPPPYQSVTLNKTPLTVWSHVLHFLVSKGLLSFRDTLLSLLHFLTVGILEQMNNLRDENFKK